MGKLNEVIREACMPYSSIIKTIKETKPTFDLSYLYPALIEVVNHRPLSEIDITDSLFALSKFLKALHEVPCIVFIDEYDTPYDTAYQYGYYEKARPIMSQLLNSLLKVLILSHT
jgi:hypothetical protein